MDPLTHGLVGASIAKLGFRRKHAMTALVIAAVAADADFITRLWGVAPFLRYHRGITHGVLALIVVPYLIALVLGLRKGFLYFFSISFVGYLSHLLLDVTNQYGTRVLSPLDWNKYALDLTFIIDPYVIIGFALCLLLSWRFKQSARNIVIVTLVAFAAYIGIRYVLHQKAEDFLRTKVDAYKYRVCPLPNDFLRWWFVAEARDGVEVGFVDLFTQRVYVDRKYGLPAENGYVEKSKKTELVKDFIYFARFPFVETLSMEDGGVEVVWSELSYAFLPGERFRARVRFDRDGNIIKTVFKF